MCNIADLSKFENFMKMCANRVGNILNHDMMASDLGLPVETVWGWLSILEASYIIFRARPYYNNFEKRIVKRPKIYFYDTGLASYLLELESEPELQTSSFRGKLFENLVASEIKKKLLNQGRISTPIYFWNIEKGEESPYEVDILFKAGGAMRAVEVKAANTLNPRWFHGATRLNELMPVEKYVLYNGPTVTIPEGKALNFKDLAQIFIDTPIIDPRHKSLDED